MNIFEFCEVEVEDVEILNSHVTAIKIVYGIASVYRTKHIQLLYFFARESLDNGELAID